MGDTKLLKHEEMIAELRNGRKARRGFWSAGAFLLFRNGAVLLDRDGSSEPYESAAIYDDWELVPIEPVYVTPAAAFEALKSGKSIKWHYGRSSCIVRAVRLGGGQAVVSDAGVFFIPSVAQLTESRWEILPDGDSAP